MAYTFILIGVIRENIMNYLFKHGALLKSKEHVHLYTKRLDNKVYAGVAIDDEYPDYICYPYDLVWRLGVENFDTPPLLSLTEKLDCNITLKDYQQECMDKLIDEPRGIFISPPGTGKTVMALWLMAQLNLKTLIIVNSIYLLNQWREECEKFLNYKPGIIGDGEYEVKEITIASFQSLRKEERLIKVRDKFSFVIVDECHRVPANTFKTVLSNLTAYWKLGITGTYRRKDRLEFVADWMLSAKKVTNNYDDTLKPSVLIVSTGISLPDSDGYTDCLNNLEDDMMLIDKIDYMVKKCGEDRHQLIISFRLATVDILSARFPDAIIVTGQTDRDERKNLNERVLDKKIIISTTLQEGVNIPNLDTIHLIHPNNNLPMLEQRIKRINRPVDGKKNPFVIDYWYKHGKESGFNVNSQQQERLRFYKRQGYKIYDL